MSKNITSYRKPKFLATVIALLGLAFFYMGVLLIGEGGTLYYALSGLTLLVNALLLFRGDRRGATLYGLFLLATYGWSVYEVRFDAWALMPRVGMFSVLGLWFLLPGVRRGLLQAQPPILFRQRVTQASMAFIALFVVVLIVANSGYEVKTASAMNTGQVTNESGDWSDYGATKSGTRYAGHTQINRENVSELERGWEFRTKVSGTFKGTPIQIGDSLFLCTGKNIMISLDPDSGAERWRFDPKINTPPFGFWDTCRGVTYYQVPIETPVSSCPERIFTATTDARLIAVDKLTGQLCGDFGNNGEISLLPGMGTVKPGFYFVTSPPTIVNGVLVLGGWVADNQEIEEPSGVVRGFDPLNGELLWAWDMGREDRTGLPAANETYTRGTPNVWSLTSADEELGLIYVPTGNATPDYYGGHRSEAMEKYASSVVAIDALTGHVRWHFQTTHHDIWDYDVPSQPSLVDVPINGVTRKALVIATKRAEVFMLDRATGEPLTEVEEILTPQTDVDQEWTSATQPFSTGMPSFSREPLSGADMWGITPFDQLACRLQFNRLRYEGPLTPPSTGGSLYYPGIAGGMNWGSVAIDEVNQLMVVNVLHMPFVVRLIPRKDVTENMVLGLGGQQAGTPYAVYSMPFLSPIFSPCLRPPFGEMAVVDLASQQVLWRRALGTAKEQGPLGIKSYMPLPMGMFYQAGSIVTGGGLIFNGGVMDSTMRAIDLFTGEEVWSDSLPASSQATPMTYVSSQSGRQYVLVTVPFGLGGPLNGENAAKEETDDTNSEGGYVIAYRLPE
ncbi:MAG: membrane-bound PQQ-dependent dehydrogenase (glucose/quinate/shikimate family) [Gammaproteobacteria bacterium]|jgi:membrane-bound PQQ-dependent dehydrogenase (glucose/quinate/shikimate family)